MRPLPWAPEPALGETLLSYVDRLAAGWEVPLGRMLRRVGLVRHREKPPPGFGIALSADRTNEFAAAAWLSPEEVHRMTLASLPGVVPRSGAPPGTREFAIDAAQRAWAYLPDTHFCPACLRERAGAWRLSWKVPWSFVCVAHDCLLVSACDRCGARPGAGRRNGGTEPRLLREVPLPAHCRARWLDADCGADFRQVAAASIKAAPSLVHAQSVVSAVLTEGDGDFGGRTLPARDWFAEMRSVVALVMHIAEGEDLPIEAPSVVRDHYATFLSGRNAGRARQSGGPRNRFFMRTPRSPLLMAAIVPWAVLVAESQCPSELRLRLSPLLDRLAQRLGRYAAPLIVDRFHLAPHTGAAATDHLRRLTPGDRWQAVLRRLPAAPVRLYLRPHQIPRLIWVREWNEIFEALLRTKFSQPARCFCSVALSRRLWGGTWNEAAERIGVAPGVFDARGYIDRLVRQKQLAEFVSRLDLTARRLGQTIPLIDYRQRERHLAAMGPVDAFQWRTRVGLGSGAADRRYGSAWVWSELTGLDGAEAPFLKTTPEERDRYRRFVRERLPLLLDQLSGLVRDCAVEEFERRNAACQLSRSRPS